MHSRKLALSLAKQLRTCPPPYIRKSTSHAAFVQQHIALCPYCSSGLEEDEVLWDILAKRIVEPSTVPRADPYETAVSTGQLRNIRMDLGAWRDGFFYTPPCILVLDADNAIPGGIAVAQTYSDISLAAPGDLILSAEQTGADGLFVECWNRYTLTDEYLDAVVGQVDSEVVQAATAIEKDPSALPGWAALPKPIAENDPRTYFRELEVEVGYTFASRAVGELLSILEEPGVHLAYSSPVKTQEAIRKILPGVSWPRKPGTNEEALLTVILPSEQYRKAASSDDSHTAQINIVVLEDGLIKYMSATPTEIAFRRLPHGKIALSGKIQDMPPEYNDAELLCCLSTIDSLEIITPGEVDWDEKEGLFYAEFDVSESMEFIPYIAVVFQDR